MAISTHDEAHESTDLDLKQGLMTKAVSTTIMRSSTQQFCPLASPALRDSSQRTLLTVKQQTRRNDRCRPRVWLPDLATPHQQIFPSAISTTLSSELVVLVSLFLLFSSIFLPFCLISACFLNQNDQTTNFLLFSHNSFSHVVFNYFQLTE